MFQYYGRKVKCNPPTNIFKLGKNLLYYLSGNILSVAIEGLL